MCDGCEAARAVPANRARRLDASAGVHWQYAHGAPALCAAHAACKQGPETAERARDLGGGVVPEQEDDIRRLRRGQG